MTGHSSVVCRGKECNELADRNRKIARTINSIRVPDRTYDTRVVILDKPNHIDWHIFVAAVLAAFVISCLWILSKSIGA